MKIQYCKQFITYKYFNKIYCFKKKKIEIYQIKKKSGSNKQSNIYNYFFLLHWQRRRDDLFWHYFYLSIKYVRCIQFTSKPNFSCILPTHMGKHFQFWVLMKTILRSFKLSDFVESRKFTGFFHSLVRIT